MEKGFLLRCTYMALCLLGGSTCCLAEEIGKVSSYSFEKASHGHPLGRPRIYENPVSFKEACDIAYIVNFLANKSLLAIAIEKGSLEKAGERIDEIHPFRFLMTIFMDEELKVNIRNIRSRGGYIWNSFLEGIKNSLDSEARIANLKEKYIVDFAKNLNIEISLIRPLLHARQWEQFINTLITHIPRKGSYDRYDN